MFTINSKYNTHLPFDRMKMVARKTIILKKKDRIKNNGRIFARVKIDDDDYQELYELEKEILEREDGIKKKNVM